MVIGSTAVDSKVGAPWKPKPLYCSQMDCMPCDAIVQRPSLSLYVNATRTISFTRGPTDDLPWEPAKDE